MVSSMPCRVTWKKPHVPHASSTARRACGSSSRPMSMTGMSLMPRLRRTSRALARLQPVRKERGGIDLDGSVEGDAVLLEPSLQGSVAHGIEHLGAAADVSRPDEDLR